MLATTREPGAVAVAEGSARPLFGFAKQVHKDDVVRLAGDVRREAVTTFSSQRPAPADTLRVDVRYHAQPLQLA